MSCSHRTWTPVSEHNPCNYPTSVSLTLVSNPKPSTFCADWCLCADFKASCDTSPHVLQHPSKPLVSTEPFFNKTMTVIIPPKYVSVCLYRGVLFKKAISSMKQTICYSLINLTTPSLQCCFWSVKQLFVFSRWFCLHMSLVWDRLEFILSCWTEFRLDKCLPSVRKQTQPFEINETDSGNLTSNMKYISQKVTSTPF